MDNNKVRIIKKTIITTSSLIKEKIAPFLVQTASQ